MNEIANITSISNPLPIPAAVETQTNLASPVAADDQPVDRVEFTTLGQRLAEVAGEMSSYRVARVLAIRSAIEAGTFETPERIAGTVNRLLSVIR